LRDLERLVGLLRELGGGSTLLGYRAAQPAPVFGEIRGLEDLPLSVSDVQGPGYYRLVDGYRFRHTYGSPKHYLLPPEHAILVVKPSYEVVEPERESGGVVFFGIKPCDLWAVEVLDRILLGKHPVYTARRRGVQAIIVEECLEPGETCFCALMGYGPVASGGYDLAYARLDRDRLVFKPSSKLGWELVERLSLREAGDEVVEEYLDMVERAVDTMKRRMPSLERATSAFKRLIGSVEFWEKVSERCVGCANCNYVCPTCFCTEIVDRVESDHATRVATWTGCLSYTYGLVAGGHFRRELYMRYRHFVLHKFLFYPKQIGGLVGCVGCGRCITWCPLGVDLRETLKRAVEVAGLES
jgi:ferredoxin